MPIGAAAQEELFQAAAGLSARAHCCRVESSCRRRRARHHRKHPAHQKRRAGVGSRAGGAHLEQPRVAQQATWPRAAEDDETAHHAVHRVPAARRGGRRRVRDELRTAAHGRGSFGRRTLASFGCGSAAAAGSLGLGGGHLGSRPDLRLRPAHARHRRQPRRALAFPT